MIEVAATMVSQSSHQLQVPEEVLGLGAVRHMVADTGHAGCSWRLKILCLQLWLRR